MIRPFAGTTLTEIAVKKILNSNVLPKENFYLAVHEPELIQVGKNLGVNVFERSRESALWDGGPDAHMTGLYEWWNKLPFKYVILVNACTPFLTVESIDKFIVHYMNSDSNGAFAVMKKMNYFWDENYNFITPLRDAAMNTKNVQITYEAAHCLYASRLDSIGDSIWMGDFNKPGDIELVEIEERECFDVDYEWEFKMYEKLYSTMVNK